MIYWICCSIVSGRWLLIKGSECVCVFGFDWESLFLNIIALFSNWWLLLFSIFPVVKFIILLINNIGDSFSCSDIVLRSIRFWEILSNTVLRLPFFLLKFGSPFVRAFVKRSMFWNTITLCLVRSLHFRVQVFSWIVTLSFNCLISFVIFLFWDDFIEYSFCMSVNLLFSCCSSW